MDNISSILPKCTSIKHMILRNFHNLNSIKLMLPSLLLISTSKYQLKSMVILRLITGLACFNNLNWLQIKFYKEILVKRRGVHSKKQSTNRSNGLISIMDKAIFLSLLHWNLIQLLLYLGIWIGSLLELH